MVDRTGQQVERHLVRRAASLRSESRQLRFEFGRDLQVHETSVGCLDIAVNRRLAPHSLVGLRQSELSKSPDGRRIVQMPHTAYYYAPGGKYVLFLDLLGFTAFVRSAFQKKAEETDDREKEFELAQNAFERRPDIHYPLERLVQRRLVSQWNRVL